MATKFDVLEALIDAKTDALGGDDLGNHHVLAVIVTLIGQPHTTVEDLVDEIYDTIAEAFVDSPDRPEAA
ncbi:hypothetical protein [Microbacterium sp. GXS0129]|uniref:hypothetical protein n=1 Tax=Microbacterium sp. GXS0129 TaxID=3377836 RepID=UPI00383B7A86